MASHTVIQQGDKVVIRDLDVFCGYVPDLDKPGSSVEQYDRAKVEAVVERTNAIMSRGQLPRLVERHKREGETVDPACFGCFPSVRCDVREGVPYIVTDLEVPKAIFDSHIGSGRFPRLSAEIWKDGHMSEVALLGRETPARPIADMRFTKVGDREIFEMPEGGTFPGQGNVAVPTLIESPKKGGKKKPMADSNDDGTEIKEAFAKQLADTTASLKSQFEKQIETEREMFAKAIADVNARAASAENEARREKFGRVIDQMDAEGFRVNLVRDQLLEKLCSAKDSAAEIDFFRKVITKDPIGVRVDLSGTSTGDKTVFSKDEIEREMAEIVKETAGKPAEFAKRIAKFTQK